VSARRRGNDVSDVSAAAVRQARDLRGSNEIAFAACQ